MIILLLSILVGSAFLTYSQAVQAGIIRPDKTGEIYQRIKYEAAALEEEKPKVKVVKEELEQILSEEK